MERNSRKLSLSDSSTRCKHTSSNGSRCRMLCAPQSLYCQPHDKSARQDAAALAAEFAKAAAGSLSSPEDVQRVLAKVFVAFLSGRLSSRKAAVSGYLAQMLLQIQREVLSHQRQQDKKELEAEFKFFCGKLDLQYPERARESFKRRLADIEEHEKKQAVLEAAMKAIKDAANKPATKAVVTVSAPAKSSKVPATAPVEPPTPPGDENSRPTSAALPSSESIPGSIARPTSESRSPSEKSSDPSHPVPPTSSSGLQSFLSHRSHVATRPAEICQRNPTSRRRRTPAPRTQPPIPIPSGAKLLNSRHISPPVIPNGVRAVRNLLPSYPRVPYSPYLRVGLG